ncbi:ribonuclease P [Candidatus Woesearchaeota archaeon]|jgi:ribonuclease P protein subunit RPR2|nr:ribonuclease P [Candidatus Woesearchaeota archaeon]|tara:strand:- start:1069 stop:1383 length:315 start_codon:yes stop_codon:yes gene_type:complete
MKRKHIKKPEKQRKIALERITILFSEAKKIFKEEPKLADKYIKLARKISMKYKVKIPSTLKRRYCKHCHKYLVPGTNVRVRTHKGHMVYYCLSCKHIMRFVYKK